MRVGRSTNNHMVIIGRFKLPTAFKYIHRSCIVNGLTINMTYHYYGHNISYLTLHQLNQSFTTKQTKTSDPDFHQARILPDFLIL